MYYTLKQKHKIKYSCLLCIIDDFWILCCSQTLWRGGDQKMWVITLTKRSNSQQDGPVVVVLKTHRFAYYIIYMLIIYTNLSYEGHKIYHIVNSLTNLCKESKRGWKQIKLSGGGGGTVHCIYITQLQCMCLNFEAIKNVHAEL